MEHGMWCNVLPAWSLYKSSVIAYLKYKVSTILSVLLKWYLLKLWNDTNERYNFHRSRDIAMIRYSLHARLIVHSLEIVNMSEIFRPYRFLHQAYSVKSSKRMLHFWLRLVFFIHKQHTYLVLIIVYNWLFVNICIFETKINCSNGYS